MKAIIVHKHTVINIPRKGKQREPTVEQMLDLIDRQIVYFEKEILIWREMKSKIQFDGRDEINA